MKILQIEYPVQLDTGLPSGGGGILLSNSLTTQHFHLQFDQMIPSLTNSITHLNLIRKWEW